MVFWTPLILKISSPSITSYSLKRSCRGKKYIQAYFIQMYEFGILGFPDSFLLIKSKLTVVKLLIEVMKGTLFYYLPLVAPQYSIRYPVHYRAISRQKGKEPLIRGGFRNHGLEIAEKVSNNPLDRSFLFDCEYLNKTSVFQGAAIEIEKRISHDVLDRSDEKFWL